MRHSGAATRTRSRGVAPDLTCGTRARADFFREQIGALKSKVRGYDEKSRAAAAELRDQARALAAREDEMAALRQTEALLREASEASDRLAAEKDPLSSQVDGAARSSFPSS
jgi:hypothetical protein